MTQSVSEPVNVAARMTGADIIDDVCSRLAERLAKNCNLRVSDSYASYSCKITVDLNLVDLETVVVDETLAIGQLPPPPPVATVPQQQSITVDIPPTFAEAVVGPAVPDTLERSVDGSAVEQHVVFQPNLEVHADGTPVEGIEPPQPKRYASRRWAVPAGRGASDVVKAGDTK